MTAGPDDRPGKSRRRNRRPSGCPLVPVLAAAAWLLLVVSVVQRARTGTP